MTGRRRLDRARSGSCSARARHRRRDLVRIAQRGDVVLGEQVGHDRGDGGILDGGHQPGPIIRPTERATPVEPEPGRIEDRAAE